MSYSHKLSLANDASLFCWVCQMFIAGEMTGLKEGIALNYAPDLKAARFLAGQIDDEIRHAVMYRSLHNYVAEKYGVKPITGIPWLLKKILNPVSGRLWEEHCFLDKAVGEQWVLYMMNFLIEQFKEPRISKTLKAIKGDELRHIEFGNEQTSLALARNARFYRFYLSGLYQRNVWGLRALVYVLTFYFKIRKQHSYAALMQEFFENTLKKSRAQVFSQLGISTTPGIFHVLASQTLFFARTLFYRWGAHPTE